MADNIELNGNPIRNLSTLLLEGGPTILLGAPGIGKSTYIDNLDAENVVIRGEEDLPITVEDPLILDDFYDLFLWYLGSESAQQKSFRDKIHEKVDVSGDVFICTTPYRLQWILNRYRDEFNKLIGGLAEWTIRPISVDEKAARAFLQQEIGNSEQITVDILRETIWEYDLREHLQGCLQDSEQFDDIFEQEHYTTLNPQTLTRGGSGLNVEQMLDRQTSAIETVQGLLGDFAASGALSPSRMVDKGETLLSGAKEFTASLIDQNAFDKLIENVQPVLSKADKVLPDHPSIVGSTVASAATTASAPIVAIGCLGYWVYATRRESKKTRDTVREEFQLILGSDLLKLTPAERESLEESYALEPKTLLYLNRAASGANWDKLDKTINRLDATIERVDELEETVKRYEATVETVIDWIRTTRRGPKIYQTLGEFENELYDLPKYVPIACKIKSGPEQTFNLAGPDFTQEEQFGTDARKEIIRLLEKDEESIILVSGESGIGKSRLLAEVGRELQDHSNKETWYVQNPAKVEEPPFAEDTVLFLDGLGQMREHRKNFLELVAKTRRVSGTERQLKIVAAVRPVYIDEIKSNAIPEHVPRYEITLERLSEEHTIELLSDFGVSLNTAKEIHRATGGNPFLSRLLALAEKPKRNTDRSPEEKIAEIIEQKMVREIEQIGEEIDIRGLLDAIAVLGEYNLTHDAEYISEFFNVGKTGTQRRMLRVLEEKNYIRAESDESVATVYTHELDIFAEYLRWQILVRDSDIFLYQELIKRCISTSPVSISSGLVELSTSSLDRFEFFDLESVLERVRQLLSLVATNVIDANISIDRILKTQLNVAFIEPNAVPHDELQKILTKSEKSENTPEHLSDLANMYYRRGSDLINWERKGVDVEKLEFGISSAELFNRGDEWVGQLEDIVKTNPDNNNIQLQFSKGIHGAISYRGAAGKPELIPKYLTKLKKLADSNSDNSEIQYILAESLYNAAHPTIVADEEQMQIYLQELEEMANNHPNNADIQLAFAESLCNAINYDGTYEIHTYLSQLKELANRYSDNADLQQALARGLRSAIGSETVTQEIDQVSFEGPPGALHPVTEPSDDEQIQSNLNQLREISDNHPNKDSIQLELAEGLDLLITDNGLRGECKQMRMYVAQLKQLANSHPDNINIQSKFAEGLHTSIMLEGMYNRGGFKEVNESAGIFSSSINDLEHLAANYPNSADIQLHFARGLFILASIEGASGDLENMRMRINKLGTLADSHSENTEIQFELAKGLMNSILYENSFDEKKEIQTYIDKLEIVTGRYPTNTDFQVILAKGLSNALSSIDERSKICQARVYLDTLERVARDHSDNDEIQQVFANNIYRLIRYEHKWGTVEQMRIRLDQLRELAESHTEIVQFNEMATLGHIFAIKFFILDGEYQTASEIIQELCTFTESVSILRLGPRSKNTREALGQTYEHLIRNERLEVLECLNNVIKEGLTGAQFSMIETRTMLLANLLWEQNEVSKDTYLQTIGIFNTEPF